MKVIELEQDNAFLTEMMKAAVQEPVIVRGRHGELFVFSVIDAFDVEVESLRRNQEFMAFLETLSHEEATISLEELRKELNV